MGGAGSVPPLYIPDSGVGVRKGPSATLIASCGVNILHSYRRVRTALVMIILRSAFRLPMIDDRSFLYGSA